MTDWVLYDDLPAWPIVTNSPWYSVESRTLTTVAGIHFRRAAERLAELVYKLDGTRTITVFDGSEVLFTRDYGKAACGCQPYDDVAGFFTA